MRLCRPRSPAGRSGFAGFIGFIGFAGFVGGDRSAPSLGKITLTAKKAILGVRIPFDVLDLNIERDQFEQSLMEEIAKRVSLDLEELIVIGDTGSCLDDLFLSGFFFRGGRGGFYKKNLVQKKYQERQHNG